MTAYMISGGRIIARIIAYVLLAIGVISPETAAWLSNDPDVALLIAGGVAAIIAELLEAYNAWQARKARRLATAKA